MVSEMKYLLVLLCCVLGINFITCPPVDKKDEEKGKNSTAEVDDDPDWLRVEYNRYLREVVEVLEGDEAFRQKLEDADADEIRKGHVAENLDLVGHNVRTKLDELKRREIERLRKISIKQYEENRGIDRKHLKVPTHINYKNPHTFEVEDLRKLIIQTTKDLEMADEERKEDFKKYEMEKEYKRQKELEKMDEEHRKKAEQQFKDSQKRHKDHPKVHHPGAKAQLEEVWEKQDHMEQQEFDPHTFFKLHDLDGNGHWDEKEVNTLFKVELDKMYDPNNPDDDWKERMEEMELMREHVYKETDTNRDGLISYQEFLEQTKRQEFQDDEGWDSIDEHTQFNEDDYKQYVARREEELKRIMAQNNQYPHYQQPGMPPHPNDIPQPGQYAVPPGHGGQQGSPPQPGQQGVPHPGQFAGQQGAPHPGNFVGQQGVPHTGQFAVQGVPQPGHLVAQPGVPQPGQFAGQQGAPQPGQFARQQGVPQPGQFAGQQGAPQPGQFAGQQGVPHPGQFSGQQGVPQPGQFAGQQRVPQPGQFDGQQGVPQTGQFAGQHGVPQPGQYGVPAGQVGQNAIPPPHPVEGQGVRQPQRQQGGAQYVDSQKEKAQNEIHDKTPSKQADRQNSPNAIPVDQGKLSKQQPSSNEIPQAQPKRQNDKFQQQQEQRRRG